MPSVGLGVFQSSPEDTVQAVTAALAAGYRLIDTAAAYQNEAQVGEGIRKSGVARNAIFVETKLWMTDYGYDEALHAFDRSMGKLGIEKLDLYLLHWPMPTQFERTVQAWRAAERLLAEGRTRAIGVSNFSLQNLDDLIARSGVVPAVNQIELHPYFAQRELRAAHQRLGIVTQAWSPIGGIARYSATAGKDPLNDPVVKDLATIYGKTPAQIILRWHLEHGVAVVPKSVRPERIEENFAVFDFRLTSEAVAGIDLLDIGARGGPPPESVDDHSFPIKIED
ncbi:MAG: aldo/keto reductase [Verrucomicrobiales bacterium]|nr:aldo/keto reductase [Verrucomicrobiales bacterium]